MKKRISIFLSLLLAFICFFSVSNINVSALSDKSFTITSSKTPISSEKTNLKWSKKFGNTPYDVPSSQIIVENTMIVMCRKKLYKLNLSDGEIIQSFDMADTPSFNYTMPTYADGTIYLPLDNGQIQAVDFGTFKSKWLYRDELGGQSLTQIIYDNGKIYTGFWNDENENANYVCIDTKDEDTTTGYETKEAKWKYKHLGGFYWAGCAISGDFVVFGGDDGTVYDDKPSKLFSLNKNTGEVVDSLDTIGDVRATIAYYPSNRRFYAVTKAGHIYSVKLLNNGKFDKNSIIKGTLGGASTAMPVIYKNRLYVGVQGDSLNKGYLKVIDASTLSEIYKVTVKGYSQNFVLLSTAYERKFDEIYIYTTYNVFPGGISVLKDKEGQTSGEMTELYTPDKDKRNYCISPIIADNDGTLYYKNDSGNLFAIENTEIQDESFFETIWYYIKKPFVFIYNYAIIVVKWIKSLF